MRNVLSGNKAATLRASSSGIIVSMSLLNTSVGTAGYVPPGGTTGAGGVGSSQYRHALTLSFRTAVCAALEKGLKEGGGKSATASANWVSLVCGGTDHS